MADPMDSAATARRRCTAQSKQTGEQCKLAPAPGATVCRFHGGRAPQTAAAAERRVQEAEAGRVIAKLWDRDATPVTNAVVELQALGGSMRQALDVLGRMVSGDDDPCEVCGRVDVDLDSAVGVAWQRQQRELRLLLADMERLGIAERMVEVEADRIRLVAAAVGRVFEVLGLSPEQRSTGVRVLLEQLRAGPMVAGQAEEVDR